MYSQFATQNQLNTHYVLGICNMNNTDIYIEKYKELEKAVRNAYGLNKQDSISYYLTNQPRFSRYKDDIQYCQEVRNWLQHNVKVNNSFAIVPNEAMINFIDVLIKKIKTRLRCCDIAIPVESVYYESIYGNVRKAMQTMQNKTFTHVPIMRNGCVIGVFDENSIFNYLTDDEIVEVDNDLSFMDIEKYIGINDREMEVFTFIKHTAFLEDLEKIFEKYFRKGQRVGMAFLTADGKATSKLMGIITPWDMIGKE